MSTSSGLGKAGSGELGEAAARLTQDTAELVRQEIRAARGEALAMLRQAGMGSGLLAGAGVCGVLALGSAHQTVSRALERVMGPVGAGAALTTGYATSAGVLAVAGRNRLRDAGTTSGDAFRRLRDDLPGGGAA